MKEIVDTIKKVITDNSYEDFHHYRIQKTDLEDIAIQIAIQIYNAITKTIKTLE